MAQETPRSIPNDHRSPDIFVVGCAGTLALLSASCCILPIGLSMIGLGGSWLTLFGPFVAHRPAILGVVGLVLIWTTVRLVRRPPCRGRHMGTVLTLGFAMFAFVAAVAAPVWSAQAQRVMWAIYQERRS